jgi:hypothetical protein
VGGTGRKAVGRAELERLGKMGTVIAIVTSLLSKARHISVFHNLKSGVLIS